MEKITYEKPRELNIFKEFIEKRKENISEDLTRLSQLFGINIEKLNEIKNNIREVLGGAEYISTTIHLRPRAIDYLNLARERISRAVNKVFYYPVYYQPFEEERPDIIDLGEYKISLIELIPGFKDRNKKREFKNSLDFHEALISYLKNTENWEEEIRENLELYLNKEFSNFDKKSREIAIEYIQGTVISILKDYKDFFDKILISKESIQECNSNLANIFLENYELLSNILERLGISKEYLEDIREKRIENIDYKFITAICILGNLVHIGAEYGKFNEQRKALGLSEIEEPEKPQERFKFFEIEAEEKAENGTLRFLFGSEENITESFILTSTYKGLEEGRFSFIDEKIRKRIRIIDFYFKLKEFKPYLEILFETTYLNSTEFINLLKNISYFDHLDEKETKVLNELLDDFKNIVEEHNIKNWLVKFGEVLDKISDDLERKGFKKEKFKVEKLIFVHKILRFLFENYISGNFEKLKNLSKEILEKFFEIHNIERLPQKIQELESEKFYGVELPIILKNLKKEDLVNLAILFELAGGEFNKSLFNKLLKNLEVKNK